MKAYSSSLLTLTLLTSCCSPASSSDAASDGAVSSDSAGDAAASLADVLAAEDGASAVDGATDAAAPDAASGACLSSGMLLLRTASTVSSIAVSGDALFWSEMAGASTTLNRIPSAGGAPTVLRMNRSIDRIAADDANVYWIEFSAGRMGSLRRMQRDGSAEITLADNLNVAGGLALDATHVYFGAIRAMRVTLMRVGKDAMTAGSESAVCAHSTVSSGILSLSLVGSNAYWTAGNSVLLYSTSTTTPSATCQQTVVGPPLVNAVAADSTHAFVAFSGLSMDRLDRIAHGSNVGARVASGAISQVVRDGADLFWAVGGEVHRASPDGAGDTVIHRGNEPVGFVVHPSGVFTVASYGTGAPSTLCRYPR